MTNRLWEGLNLMKAIILLFVLLLTLELPSVAAQQPDSSPVETVTTFFADWNKGDRQAMSRLSNGSTRIRRSRGRIRDYTLPRVHRCMRSLRNPQLAQVPFSRHHVADWVGRRRNSCVLTP